MLLQKGYLTGVSLAAALAVCVTPVASQELSREDYLALIGELSRSIPSAPAPPSVDVESIVAAGIDAGVGKLDAAAVRASLAWEHVPARTGDVVRLRGQERRIAGSAYHLRVRSVSSTASSAQIVVEFWHKVKVGDRQDIAYKAFVYAFAKKGAAWQLTERRLLELY